MQQMHRHDNESRITPPTDISDEAGMGRFTIRCGRCGEPAPATGPDAREVCIYCGAGLGIESDVSIYFRPDPPHAIRLLAWGILTAIILMVAATFWMLISRGSE